MNPELNIGDNVRCLYMPDEHSSVPPGTFGIVKGVHVILGVKQYDVIWENGSKLALLSDADIWDKGERTKKHTIKERSTGLDYLVKNDDVWEHFDMKFLRKYLLMVRDSGIVNMLQSAPYLYMGRERLEHEFKYADTNEKFEMVLENSNKAQNEMILGVINVLKSENKEESMENINNYLKKWSRKIVLTYVNLFF